MPEISAAIERIAIYLVPLLLGVTCHEVAHGYVAYLYGDPTAKDAGRLTLNPLKHLDATGTLMFIVTAMIGAFVIGWAKPVPVNPYHFRKKRQGMLFVSAAGAVTNFLLAILFALALHGLIPLLQNNTSPIAAYLLYPLGFIFRAGVDVNIILGVFNLIPIPPLDGSKIVASLLPANLAQRYLSVGRYGLLIVIILLATGLLGRILLPVVFAIRNWLL